jgi:hypothetical protein
MSETWSGDANKIKAWILIQEAVYLCIAARNPQLLADPS